MPTIGNKWSASGERRDKIKKAVVLNGYPGIMDRPDRAHLVKKYSLQRGIVYGPVQTRRLGLALGVNLFPGNDKACGFNCIYCQYGWSKKNRPASSRGSAEIPSVEQIASALSLRLEQLAVDGKNLDAISICGNGEPTLHPDFTAVVESAKRLRDDYQPAARLAMFSNSSTLANPTVREALDLVDIKLMKFDAGSEEIFHELNHLRAPIYIGDIAAALKELKNIYLHSVFVQGRITNADPDSVGLWIERLRDIRPMGVQVYTLEGEPTENKIQRVSLTTLQWIADQVRWRAGLHAEVS